MTAGRQGSTSEAGRHLWHELVASAKNLVVESVTVKSLPTAAAPPFDGVAGRERV